MDISKEINSKIIEAMKAKDAFRLKTLRYMKSLLQNNTISEKPSSDLDIILGHHKKMVKSLELYNDSALDELKKEILIIEEFLPKSLSKEEIESLIDKHISLGNMGLIMKALKEEIEGPFDGKLISNLIKEKLS